MDGVVWIKRQKRPQQTTIEEDFLSLSPPYRVILVYLLILPSLSSGRYLISSPDEDENDEMSFFDCLREGRLDGFVRTRKQSKQSTPTSSRTIPGSPCHTRTMPPGISTSRESRRRTGGKFWPFLNHFWKSLTFISPYYGSTCGHSAGWKSMIWIWIPGDDEVLCVSFRSFMCQVNTDPMMSQVRKPPPPKWAHSSHNHPKRHLRSVMVVIVRAATFLFSSPPL